MTTIAQENPGATELTQLAALISQAVSTLISEYNNAGVTIPNLNDSSHGKSGVSQHPYLSSSEVLGNAVKTIGAACAQLSAAVARPGDVVVNKALSYLESACLKIAVDARIPDLLLDQPNGVHVDQLAEKSNRDPGKLARVLRTLATNHIFIEVKPNVFANNQLSLKLVSSEPVRAIVEVFLKRQLPSTDDSMKAGAFLGDALADPTTAFSYKLEDTAFKRINGASIYEMCAADKAKGEVRSSP
ncbi:hypothetical protein VKT23_019459 [Stygiomarasmius scandens]|uniref:O-methyltransferase dimerisation domain-containing protein n=1 Tax=Marasmiellus scandens TaxID=2682957 RepID=A0ABR1IQ81_9AGAR